MVSTATDKLDIPGLPLESKGCHKFPDMSLPLISVRKLCASDLSVHFNKKQVQVCGTDGNPILAGELDPKTELYMISLNNNNNNHINTLQKGGNKPERAFYTNSILSIQTIPALMDFYHCSLGCPPISTWTDTIKKGWFLSWPALTADRVQEHCSKKPQTAFGHLRLRKQNIQSTKEEPTIIMTDKPKVQSKNSKRHRVELTLVDDLKSLIAMDLPGRYPCTSTRGHKYIFIMYDHDNNYILAKPIKSRKSSELVRGFKECYLKLAEAGINAQVIRLDNEINQELIAAIKEQDLQWQQV